MRSMKKKRANIPKTMTSRSRSESSLQRSVVKELRSSLSGFYCFKVDQRAMRGVADVIGCYGGRFIALEMKRGELQATPLQQYFLNQVRDAGGFAEVVNEVTRCDVVNRLKAAHKCSCCGQLVFNRD